MNVSSSRFALTAVSVALLLLTMGTAVAGPNHVVQGAQTPAGVVAKASGVTLSAINLTADACAGISGTLTVTATGTTDDGGGNDTIWFTIFDDSVEKFARAITVPVGSTVSTVIAINYPGQIGGSAPGIGLEIGESRDGSDLVSDDPFFPAQIAGCSAPGATTATPVPALSTWSMSALASLLGLFGLGALIARRRR